MGVWHHLRICCVIAALVLTIACEDETSGLAAVGGQPVQIEAFQRYVDETTGDAWQGVSARVSSRLLDQYLDRQVILEAANRRGLSLAAESPGLGPMEVQWLLDELCGPPPDPDNSEVENEVAKRLDATRPRQAHVRQVLVDSQEQALVARQRLVDEEDFLVVSREMSRAPNAAGGGELGFIEQGSLPPEIDDVIFSLEEGEISEPVPGPSGFHVFQVLEVVPAGPPDRSEVEANVLEEYSRRNARGHRGSCIQGLVSEIGIVVYRNNLWFPYTGKYAEEQSNA
jgi:hypothetical protein